MSVHWASTSKTHLIYIERVTLQRTLQDLTNREALGNVPSLGKSKIPKISVLAL